MKTLLAFLLLPLACLAQIGPITGGVVIGTATNAIGNSSGFGTNVTINNLTNIGRVIITGTNKFGLGNVNPLYPFDALQTVYGTNTPYDNFSDVFQRTLNSGGDVTSDYATTYRLFTLNSTNSIRDFSSAFVAVRVSGTNNLNRGQALLVHFDTEGGGRAERIAAIRGSMDHNSTNTSSGLTLNFIYVPQLDAAVGSGGNIIVKLIELGVASKTNFSQLWGIWQTNNAMSNWFAGNIGVGLLATRPFSQLDVYGPQQTPLNSPIAINQWHQTLFDTRAASDGVTGGGLLLGGYRDSAASVKTAWGGIRAVVRSADSGAEGGFLQLCVNANGNMIVGGQFDRGGIFYGSSNIISVATVIATNSFASYDTNTWVAINPTGWTNTLGKNAQVHLDGIGVTYEVYNSAGVGMYTNPATVIHGEPLLQAGGKILITAGTSVTGHAVPF